MPVAGSEPRRARHPIAAGLPHGREVIAACAVLVLLAHLLLAQLTFVLAVAFAVITRLGGWRWWWLIVPGAAGVVLALAIGPGHAAAGFVAGPGHILGYLGHGHLAARLGHPLGAFASAGTWLPEQLPIALIAGAAEAAVIRWLDWLHTDERAVAPPRPGAIATLRGALTIRMIGAGGVVTRDGCALGVVAATGAIAELRWSQAAGGVLVTGASPREVTVTGLQVVHAALRRRKPLIVIDSGAGAAIARVIEAACQATGTPLRLTDVDLDLVIGERTAALVAARSPEHAIRACGDITALAAHLRRIGVDGDGLVWVPAGERLPAQALAALIRAGGSAGLAVLITTPSPAAAAELSGLVSALLIHRVTDQALAASLATVTGTPFLPARALLSLGPAEFVLAAPGPGGRPAQFGRLIPARLPSVAPSAAGSPPAARSPWAAVQERRS
jgi:hypothetical protein